jgi:hypothetical protein
VDRAIRATPWSRYYYYEKGERLTLYELIARHASNKNVKTTVNSLNEYVKEVAIKGITTDTSKIRIYTYDHEDNVARLVEDVCDDDFIVVKLPIKCSQLKYLVLPRKIWEQRLDIVLEPASIWFWDDYNGEFLLKIDVQGITDLYGFSARDLITEKKKELRQKFEILI